MNMIEGSPLGSGPQASTYVWRSRADPAGFFSQWNFLPTTVRRLGQVLGHKEMIRSAFLWDSIPMTRPPRRGTRCSGSGPRGEWRGVRGGGSCPDPTEVVGFVVLTLAPSGFRSRAVFILYYFCFCLLRIPLCPISRHAIPPRVSFVGAWFTDSRVSFRADFLPPREGSVSCIKESRRAHKRERKRHRRSTKKEKQKKKKKRRRHKGIVAMLCP